MRLNRVVMKYKDLDLVKRLGPNKIYYLIPSEWIINYYKIGNSEAIPGKDCYIYSNQFNKILINSTGRTPQEWYDHFILGILTDDERPKCKNCNKPLKFVSVRLGYGHIPGSNMANKDNLFCSRKCTISYVSSHTEEYPVFNEFHKNGQAAGYMLANPDKYPGWITYINSGSGFGLCNRNSDKYGLIGFKNPETHKRQCINGRFTDFMNRGSADDPCEFYIASTTTGFKFGITSNSRVRLEYAANYIKLKVILKATRLQVASIERFIKNYLNQSHEYLPWNQTHKFRKAYLLALELFIN